MFEPQKCANCGKDVENVFYEWFPNGGICNICKEKLFPKIKICCHTCTSGYIYEDSYPDCKRIKVICPECKGKKYLETEAVP
jgi:hypothetical protein